MESPTRRPILRTVEIGKATGIERAYLLWIGYSTESMSAQAPPFIAGEVKCCTFLNVIYIAVSES